MIPQVAGIAGGVEFEQQCATTSHRFLGLGISIRGTTETLGSLGTSVSSGVDYVGQQSQVMPVDRHAVGEKIVAPDFEASVFSDYLHWHR